MHHKSNDVGASSPGRQLYSSSRPQSAKRLATSDRPKSANARAVIAMSRIDADFDQPISSSSRPRSAKRHPTVDRPTNVSGKVVGARPSSASRKVVGVASTTEGDNPRPRSATKPNGAADRPKSASGRIVGIRPSSASAKVVVIATSEKKIYPSADVVDEQTYPASRPLSGKRPHSATGSRKTGAMMLMKKPKDPQVNNYAGITSNASIHIYSTDIINSIADESTWDTSTGNDRSREKYRTDPKKKKGHDEDDGEDPSVFAGLSSTQLACLGHIVACIIMCFSTKRRVAGECGRDEM